MQNSLPLSKCALRQTDDNEMETDRQREQRDSKGGKRRTGRGENPRTKQGRVIDSWGQKIDQRRVESPERQTFGNESKMDKRTTDSLE